MKYELYLGLNDRNLINEATEFLLEESKNLEIDITIIQTKGSFNGEPENGLLVIHLSNESNVLSLNNNPIKLLGDKYKTKYNQRCFILNKYWTDINVY